MPDTFATEYLEDAADHFRWLKSLADRALAQVDDQQFFHTLDLESNSIAILAKHLAGNLRSRWTDFLTADGEKPDRNRDSEFIIEEDDTREALTQKWEAGWLALFTAVDPLTPEDLSRTIHIRQEPHSIPKAINRQLAHYGYHVGQIVLLAKHMNSADWQTLSIPRGQSQTFNTDTKDKFGTAAGK
jgi:hypothetical protein